MSDVSRKAVYRSLVNFSIGKLEAPLNLICAEGKILVKIKSWITL